MWLVIVWTKHRNHYKWLLDANVKLDTIVADLANMKANMKRTMMFTGFLFVMVVFLYTNAMRKAEANFAKSKSNANFAKIDANFEELGAELTALGAELTALYRSENSAEPKAELHRRKFC